MSSASAMDHYNARKHDPEFLKIRAERTRKYRERVGRSTIREQERSWNDQLRDKVLEQYGKKCGKCGFNSDIRILQLDHINGGGNRERREIGSNGIRRKALKSPELYQLLCPNCNWTKRYDLNEQNSRSQESDM